MDFTNSFTVNVPLQQVWEFMLDAEKVTPCVPGAALTEVVDATHYKGTVKVKLGAVQMSYRGDLEMQPDEASHVIVLQAKGTETRGSGGASGTVTTRLSESQGSTTIVMDSHVDVTGRVAQFGRGIMQDVANRLTRDFARCLEAQLTAASRVGEAPAPPAQAAAGTAPPETVETAVAEEAAAPTNESAQTASSPPPSTSQAEPARATQPLPYSPLTTEIKPLELAVDITRSRLASLLRYVAAKIDPD